MTPSALGVDGGSEAPERLVDASEGEWVGVCGADRLGHSGSGFVPASCFCQSLHIMHLEYVNREEWKV